MVEATLVPLRKLRTKLRRAAEKGKTMMGVLGRCSSAERRRGRLLEELLAPVEGAGPEDLREYEYEDVGS